MMSFKSIGAALLVLALVSYQVSAQTTLAESGDAAAGGMTTEAAAAGDGHEEAEHAAGTTAGEAAGTEAPAAAEGEMTTAASGAGEFQALTKFVAVMAALSVGLLVKKD
eukprot:GHVH01006917.1.p3 GENE.GHVH01006917.1~~GHVH01006917.1.p3  ORF type:complete len:109 (+),score=20.67 GHVH01006917.1:121-447(+)